MQHCSKNAFGSTIWLAITWSGNEVKNWDLPSRERLPRNKRSASESENYEFIWAAHTFMFPNQIYWRSPSNYMATSSVQPLSTKSGHRFTKMYKTPWHQRKQIDTRGNCFQTKMLISKSTLEDYRRPHNYKRLSNSVSLTWAMWWTSAWNRAWATSAPKTITGSSMRSHGGGGKGRIDMRGIMRIIVVKTASSIQPIHLPWISERILALNPLRSKRVSTQWPQLVFSGRCYHVLSSHIFLHDLKRVCSPKPAHDCHNITHKTVSDFYAVLVCLNFAELRHCLEVKMSSTWFWTHVCKGSHCNMRTNPSCKWASDAVMSVDGRVCKRSDWSTCKTLQDHMPSLPHWFAPTGRWTLLLCFRLRSVPCGWAIAVLTSFHGDILSLTLCMPERPTHAFSTESGDLLQCKPSMSSPLHSHHIIISRSMPLPLQHTFRLKVRRFLFMSLG